ncbi:hypothetical protein HJC23_010344 [Cyclotella cryptica]|uniref:Glycosyltransferase 61 catalytic domain-containing protein n=1 Tax=Cyclotella cryptica TaxID=29204 RepID=A0ABD3QNQ1_9STRA
MFSKNEVGNRSPSATSRFRRSHAPLDISYGDPVSLESRDLDVLDAYLGLALISSPLRAPWSGLLAPPLQTRGPGATHSMSKMKNNTAMIASSLRAFIPVSASIPLFRRRGVRAERVLVTPRRCCAVTYTCALASFLVSIHLIQKQTEYPSNIMNSPIGQHDFQRGYKFSQKEPFNWDLEKPEVLQSQKTCHVVENICKTSSDWFYFVDDDRFAPIHQPQLIFKNLKGTRHIDMEWKMALAAAKPQWSQIEQEQQCMLSQTEHHVVLTGNHIHMMGEFVQRITIPLHQLIQNYITHYRKIGNVVKDVQFYVYFSQDEGQNILDSHYLYMKGLPFGDNIKSWTQVLSPQVGVAPPSCHCFKRLIFCGFLGEYMAVASNSTETDNITKLELTPSNVMPHINCANTLTPPKLLEEENCPIWQNLRTDLIRTYEQRNPHVHRNILAYRRMLVQNALKHDSLNSTYSLSDESLLDWKIIALSQRKSNRRWLNINSTMSHCNRQYYTKKIVCVVVDVEDLPTNFSEVNSHTLSAVEEQFILFRSVDALIGIHGSQLTQGILMRAHSVVVELFQWIPRHWGNVLTGVFTQVKHRPT